MKKKTSPCLHSNKHQSLNIVMDVAVVVAAAVAVVAVVVAAFVTIRYC